MLKSKYGKGMVVEDKKVLDSLLERAVKEVGTDYGQVLACVCEDILSGKHSDALRYNAMYRTSWLRKYIQTFVDVKGGR